MLQRLADTVENEKAKLRAIELIMVTNGVSTSERHGTSSGDTKPADRGGLAELIPLQVTDDSADKLPENG